MSSSVKLESRSVFDGTTLCAWETVTTGAFICMKMAVSQVTSPLSVTPYSGVKLCQKHLDQAAFFSVTTDRLDLSANARFANASGDKVNIHYINADLGLVVWATSMDDRIHRNPSWDVLRMLLDGGFRNVPK